MVIPIVLFLIDNYPLTSGGVKIISHQLYLHLMFSTQ